MTDKRKVRLVVEDMSVDYSITYLYSSFTKLKLLDTGLVEGVEHYRNRQGKLGNLCNKAHENSVQMSWSMIDEKKELEKQDVELIKEFRTFLEVHKKIRLDDTDLHLFFGMRYCDTNNFE